MLIEVLKRKWFVCCSVFFAKKVLIYPSKDTHSTFYERPAQSNKLANNQKSVGLHLLGTLERYVDWRIEREVKVYD